MKPRVHQTTLDVLGYLAYRMVFSNHDFGDLTLVAFVER